MGLNLTARISPGELAEIREEILSSPLFCFKHPKPTILFTKLDPFVEDGKTDPRSCSTVSPSNPVIKKIVEDRGCELKVF